MTTRIYTATCPVCDAAEIDVYLERPKVRLSFTDGRKIEAGVGIEDLDGPCLCRDSDLVDQGRYTEKILEATEGMDGIDIRETEEAL